MSKQDELLALIGRHYDGLSTRDCQLKLPATWFSGTSPAKEVQNALQGLKRAGLVVQREIEPEGVWHWFKVEAANGGNPNEIPDGLSVVGADAATDDAGAGVDASIPDGVIESAALALEAELKHDGPAVEFRETAVVPERFQIAPRPARIDGIAWVWAARTEDGRLFEDADQALQHRDRLALEGQITAFLNSPAAVDVPSEDYRVVLLAWETWKAASHG